jgi:hypothetical protein
MGHKGHLFILKPSCNQIGGVEGHGSNHVTKALSLGELGLYVFSGYASPNTGLLQELV